MDNTVIVHKGRTNTIQIATGIDLSADEITSEIRSEPSVSAPLIATWEVQFASDGVDGLLLLTLDDLITSQIAVSSGYMDLKRVVDGEPLAVFNEPLEVTFRGTVTA